MKKRTIICISSCFFAASVSAQTQRQLNNPLDQLQPADSSADYNLPPMQERADVIQNDQKIAVSSIVLKQVLPNADGSAIGDLIPVDDNELTGVINQLLDETNNFPSYNQINALTAQLGQILRQRGELLSTVYIPSQTVKNATLELHLLQGRLGKVEIAGEATKSADLIESAFNPSVGSVITRDNVESTLLRIQNLLPGVTARGSFKQGDKLGQSNAVIDVTDHDAFSGSVYIDNYGNDATGEIRFGTRLIFNNPTGMEDRLRIDILANETPDGFDDPQNPIEKNDYQCCFGGLSYEVFSDSLKYSVGAEWSHTQYDIGNNADFLLARLGFSGESDTTRIFANYYRTITSTFTDTIGFGWSFSQSDLSARNEAIAADVLLNRDQVSEYDLSYLFTLRSNGNVYYGQVAAFLETKDNNAFPVPSKWVGYTQRTVNAFGFPVGPSRLGSDKGNSIRLSADLNAIIASLTDTVRFKGRVAFQITDDILAPSQQFGLAGPYGVRAYPSGSFLADSGVLASFDMQIPIMSSLEASLFYDIAYGEVNDLNSAAEFDATIQGVGVGLNYQHSNTMAFQMTASYGLGVSDGESDEPGPNIRNGGEEVTGRDDIQVFASLIYNF